MENFGSIINAIHDDKTQEEGNDTVFIIDLKTCIKDLVDYWTADCFTGKNAWLRECTDAYERKEVELTEEFWEMSKNDLQTEYFDTFNVRVSIE